MKAFWSVGRPDVDMEHCRENTRLPEILTSLQEYFKTFDDFDSVCKITEAIFFR